MEDLPRDSSPRLKPGASSLVSVTKAFDLGDILSVTTGLMLSDRGMVGVHDLIGHMTGQMMTDMGCAAMRERCSAELMRQHPTSLGHPFVTGKMVGFLEILSSSPGDIQNMVEAILSTLKGFVGPTLPVDPMR